MDDNKSVNAAILERLEKVVQSLQENSVKMGELLAVHNEKLDKQDRIDAVLFEKIDGLHKEIWIVQPMKLRKDVREIYV